MRWKQNQPVGVGGKHALALKNIFCVRPQGIVQPAILSLPFLQSRFFASIFSHCILPCCHFSAIVREEIFTLSSSEDTKEEMKLTERKPRERSREGSRDCSFGPSWKATKISSDFVLFWWTYLFQNAGLCEWKGCDSQFSVKLSATFTAPKLFKFVKKISADRCPFH